jgi:hypothetical protein
MEPGALPRNLWFLDLKDNLLPSVRICRKFFFSVIFLFVLALFSDFLFGPERIDRTENVGHGEE